MRHQLHLLIFAACAIGAFSSCAGYRLGVSKPAALAKVKNIHDQLLAGNLTALDILLCSYASPDFVERGTKIKKQTQSKFAKHTLETLL